MSPERLEDIRRAVANGEKPRHTTLYRSCYSCRSKGRPDVHPIENFTIRANGVPYSACKECNKERQKERRQSKKKASAEG